VSSYEENPEGDKEEADEIRVLEGVEHKSKCLKNVNAMSRISAMLSQSNLGSSSCLGK